jgi:hypothetical protein
VPRTPTSRVGVAGMTSPATAQRSASRGEMGSGPVHYRHPRTPRSAGSDNMGGGGGGGSSPGGGGGGGFDGGDMKTPSSVGSTSGGAFAKESQVWGPTVNVEQAK